MAHDAAEVEEQADHEAPAAARPPALPTMRSPRDYRLASSVVLALLLSGIGALYLVDLQANAAGLSLFGRDLPVSCASRLAFDRPCPGCGMTRAVWLGLHGRFAEGRALHPGQPLILLWLVLQLLWRPLVIAWPARFQRWAGWDLTLSLFGIWAGAFFPWLLA